jgi:hypothetical protein
MAAMTPSTRCCPAWPSRCTHLSTLISRAKLRPPCPRSCQDSSPAALRLPRIRRTFAPAGGSPPPSIRAPVEDRLRMRTGTAPKSVSSVAVRKTFDLSSDRSWVLVPNATPLWCALQGSRPATALTRHWNRFLPTSALGTKQLLDAWEKTGRASELAQGSGRQLRPADTQRNAKASLIGSCTRKALSLVRHSDQNGMEARRPYQRDNAMPQLLSTEGYSAAVMPCPHDLAEQRQVTGPNHHLLSRRRKPPAKHPDACRRQILNHDGY